MKYLLDTNICIYLIHDHPRVLERLLAKRPDEVGISAVTLAELQYGVDKSRAVERNRRALQHFVAPLDVLPFDAAAARSYGSVRCQLERGGTPIGGMDTMIASQALALDATLVTHNGREFTRVAGLDVEDWAR